MKSSQLYLAQLALSGGVLATEYQEASGSASGPAAGVYDITPGPGYPDWNILNRNPTASSSKRLSLGWGIATEIPNGKSPTNPLTWRINITEADVPDASNASGPIPNARMVNMVYDFSWEGGENIEDTMAAIQDKSQPSGNYTGPPQLCATIFEGLFPANVTNAYNSSSDDGCEGVIPDACLQALLSLGSTTQSESGCAVPRFPNDIPVCEGVFPSSGLTMSTISLTSGGRNGSSNDTSFPLRSGEAFHFESSVAFEDGNTTYFNQQDLSLHMMVLDTVNSSRRAVCQRVNASAEAKGRNTGAEEDVPGAAVMGSIVSMWAVGMAAFGALAFLL